VNADSLRTSLKILRKIFPYRSCVKLPKKACIYYKLKLCNAPCIGLISKTTYHENFHNILEFMKGNKKLLIRELNKKMKFYSESQEYERAADIRNQLIALEKVALHKGVIKTNSSRRVSHMQELQTKLNLEKLPKRIEGFDSSHFHGDSAVVSMVVFENGLAKPNQYRRFKIKNPPSGGDDFYNLYQALSRRFHNKEWPIPDLILIDGGKGQLNQALEAQKKALIEFQSIPIISLAKKEELIFLPKLKNAIQMPMSSKALQLVQSVRDEAHRFAVTYHRKLREELPMKELRKKPVKK
jgi:excinuclease ABC subunit C